MEVGELWGVGEKTRDLLHRFGLVTVGDVAHTPLRTLQRAVGDALGSHLHQLAWGTDRREIVPRSTADDPEKSMGANETFGRDTDDRDIISRELLRLSARVTRRMRTAGVAGRTVTITVRFADFTTITRSRPSPRPPTSPARCTAPPCASTTPSGCSGPGSAWSAYASRGWSPARPCTVSWCWGSASTAGATPTGPSTGPGSGSGPTRSARPAFSPDPLRVDGRALHSTAKTRTFFVTPLPNTPGPA